MYIVSNLYNQWLMNDLQEPITTEIVKSMQVRFNIHATHLYCAPSSMEEHLFYAEYYQSIN